MTEMLWKLGCEGLRKKRFNKKYNKFNILKNFKCFSSTIPEGTNVKKQEPLEGDVLLDIHQFASAPEFSLFDSVLFYPYLVYRRYKTKDCSILIHKNSLVDFNGKESSGFFFSLCARSVHYTYCKMRSLAQGSET